MIGSVLGSAICRTESVNTPVAFTTIRAAIVNSSPALLIARGQSVHVAFRVAQQSGRRAIVHERRAVIRRGHRQMNQQARVVKLPVIIDDSAAQLFRLQRRQPLQRLFLD